jgi:uncharacterized small protein (DUF1192 family)
VKENNKQKRYVASPVQANMDDISVMTDDELREHMSFLFAEINRLAENNMLGYESAPWEKELSYYHREMQIRSRRRDAHDRYMQRMNAEAESIRMSEHHLPAMDFSKNIIDGWD